MASRAAQRTAIARAVRDGYLDEADRLRTVLKTDKVADAIRDAVNAAPKLTAEQIARLRALLPVTGTSDSEVA